MKKTFHIQLLSHNDIPTILSLQSRVLDKLGDDQNHFIKSRTELQLTAHQDAIPHMPILGAYDGGHLVGMVMLTYPDAKGDFFLAGYPFQDLGNEAEIAIVQGLLVDPAYTGQGLSSRLLTAIAEKAKDANRLNLVAKIASDNNASIATFARHAFATAVDGTDIRSNYHVVFVRADVDAVLTIPCQRPLKAA